MFEGKMSITKGTVVCFENTYDIDDNGNWICNGPKIIKCPDEEDE